MVLAGDKGQSCFTMAIQSTGESLCLLRIADESAHENRPVFTSLYHLLNEELLTKCHKELAGNKAVGIDKVPEDKKIYALT